MKSKLCGVQKCVCIDLVMQKNVKGELNLILICCSVSFSLLDLQLEAHKNTHQESLSFNKISRDLHVSFIRLIYLLDSNVCLNVSNVKF